MSAILGTSVTGAGGGAYTIDNSLRFRSSASAYLSKTNFAGSPTTFTLSMWIKRGQLGTRQELAAARYVNGLTAGYLEFLTTDQLALNLSNGSANSGAITTTAVFRDPSAWYHVVLASTSGGTVYLYVNNQQVGSASVSAGYWLFTSTANYRNTLGQYGDYNGFYYDGYMAEVNFIDGQALTPSSFAATDSSTGVWQPKAYTGSYGTNGFYLKFSDIATTSGSNAGLGKDFSGNSNYWNTNNISVTAGYTYDAMKDSPTPKSESVANFAVLQPFGTNTTGYVSQGNLAINGANAYKSAYSTIPFPSTGVWYWEGLMTSPVNNTGFGCASIGPNTPPNPLANTNGIAITSNGYWYLDTSTGTSGHTGWTAGTTVVGMKWDSSTNTFSYTVDGTTFNTVGSVSTTDGRQWAPACWAYQTTDQTVLNFGQRPFTYSIPSGAKALNTYNLPTPTVGASSTTLASKYFNNILWTGDGSLVNRSITGLGFQPDYVWSKSRSNSAVYHLRQDAVRGANYALDQTTSVEVYRPATGYMASFDSDGFTFNAGASNNINFNQNGSNYVGWCWKANGAGSSNTSGSITSTVSANTTSGFSIVTYTGTGANATVGHGLGAVPKMMIVKARNSAGWLWAVYHASVGNTGYLRLNGTDATTTDSTWQNTTPTSSVFSIGTQGHVNFNASTTYVAYCFAEKTGFSSFGKYTGNGSTDGPFVYTGFKPKFIMIKRTDAADSWYMTDGTRNPYNTVSYGLLAESANSENTGNSGSSPFLDYLSNGFKIRQSSTGMNGSGGTYIYMAFAENPFNYSLAR